MPFDKKAYDLAYQREHGEQLKISLRQGEKQIITDAAAAAGLSVRKYILQLVQQDLNRQ